MKEKQEEKQKKQVRTIQTALWAGLILVQMTVVNSLTVRAEQPIEKTVTYLRVEEAAGLPETMTVKVNTDGASYDVVCRAAETEVLEEYWLEDFVFPVTFHSYDSQYFQVGERLIPYNADQPGLEGCELQLLDMLGLSPEEYEITSVAWNGEAYRDGSGTLCRDAKGLGRRLVQDYEVRYVGSLELPAETRAESVERETLAESSFPEEAGPAETIQTAEQTEAAVAILTEQAEASEEEPQGKPLTLLEIITRIMLVAVGVGAILFFGGLLVLLIRKIRRLWKKY